MTEAEARDELLRWREYHGQRDTLIRQAHAAGVSKTDIHRITGIARTTINSILAAARSQDDDGFEAAARADFEKAADAHAAADADAAWREHERADYRAAGLRDAPRESGR